MPNSIKFILSGLVVVAAGILFVVDTAAGAGGWRYISLLVAPLMVAAMWVFPEANGKAVRKDAAKLRGQGQGSL